MIIKTRMLLIMSAGIALVAACKGKSSSDYEFINNHKNSYSTTDSVTTADTSKIGAKLVKTAGINFKVKNVQQASEHIADLTKQCNGMLMHHKVESVARQTRHVHISNDSIMRIAAYHTTADMVVKIPSDKLEDFMMKVNHIGIYVNASTMDIEDRTLDYLSARLSLKTGKIW